MQLPNSEKSYMPTLANVVMNGLDAKMVDAKMVEKVGVATIVVNKATWPVTVQKVDRHPEDESVGSQGRTHRDEIKVETARDCLIPLQEQRKAHNGLENTSEDLVADVLEKS